MHRSACLVARKADLRGSGWQGWHAALVAQCAVGVVLHPKRRPCAIRLHVGRSSRASPRRCTVVVARVASFSSRLSSARPHAVFWTPPRAVQHDTRIPFATCRKCRLPWHHLPRPDGVVFPRTLSHYFSCKPASFGPVLKWLPVFISWCENPFWFAGRNASTSWIPCANDPIRRPFWCARPPLFPRPFSRYRPGSVLWRWWDGIWVDRLAARVCLAARAGHDRNS